MKTLREKARRILTLAVALCMMLMMTLPVMAEDETNNLTATDDPRDSIMLMTLGIEDDNGTYHPYKGGTCFLINDEYVLTNKHVVTVFDQDELNDLREISGIPDMQATDSHIKLYLYVNRDMKVAATMHDSVNSSDMDFAAVKLAEKIYDRKPVALGDSDAIQTKDTVYAMGFPADSVSTKNYNTKDDVSTVEGAISKLTVTGNVDIIEHTAPLNLGNSGGPLLDKDDNVVGLNTFIAGKKNYSIQINYIKKGLDTFGIPYVTGPAGGISDGNITDSTETSGEVAEETEEEKKPDNTAILAELQSAVDEAKAVDVENYTEETVSALDDSIGAAEAVLANDSAEAAAIQGATDDLNDAITNLEEKSGPNMMMIIFIVAAVVLLVVIIIVAVVMSGKKKKSSQVPNPGPASGPRPNPGPIPSNMNGNDGYGAVDSFAKPGPSPQPQTMPEGAGETTLLDAGAGETTLLSNAGSAYLIRKKNGEKIAVNVQNFKLGKERRKVNYCISDNTSVSRVHCEIVKKGADYYVTDQGATNFTFVNGIQLSPHKETLLSDQSVLKLSDEEFEFHLS